MALNPIRSIMSLLGPARQGFRRFPRAPIAVTCRLTVAGASELAQAHVILENVSVGGALLRGALDLHAGDRVALTMRAGSARQITVTAEIVYTRTKRFEAQWLYGLRFVDVTQEQQAVLSAYVDELRDGDLIRHRLLSAPSFEPSAQRATCPCGCGGSWTGQRA